MKKVAVIMGSDSDLPVVEKCIDELKKYDIPTEVHVYSAHRTPDEAISFAKAAEENGFGVIISAAGKAAHLGGVLAANTVLPIVGIPIKASALDGMDALLSTVQMPPGIPVASIAIDGAKNAAIFAAEILAVSDVALRTRLWEERRKSHDAVIEKDVAVSAKFN
ncbi:5-(carboxyamino)imidazole ribonucleotide mutase [Mogibacterium pumilum]|uniref:N5-carboxyaminoimidazole ribonucleotide mutase n=1 Tax=Mogibacterium pumilum TaxID=86332 RepID=A0A223AU31_9FIRM|nr:5-(carboxyamino)imidazole ribonucleotide mutase [Mogibacterium pumilum]